MERRVPNGRRPTTGKCLLVGRLPVIRQSTFLPLRTITCLPVLLAQVTELRLAPARHVETPLVELDQRLASRTPRPPSPLSQLQGIDSVHVFVAPVVHTLKDLELAPHARHRPTPVCRAPQPRRVHREAFAVVLYAEEAAAGRPRTVHPLLCAELAPLLFEGGKRGLSEVLPDGSQRDALPAAGGGKERLVLRGGAEELVDAHLVVVVAAGRADLGAVYALHAGNAFLG